MLGTNLTIENTFRDYLFIYLVLKTNLTARGTCKDQNGYLLPKDCAQLLNIRWLKVEFCPYSQNRRETKL